MCKFLFTGCMHNILYKTCAIGFLMLSEKVKIIQIRQLKMGENKDLVYYRQCLGSESIGSASFCLPGSGTAKISGSKGQNINQKLKKNLLSKRKFELLKKDFKNLLIFESSVKF